jgi:flavin reductase (DIM6/NTAB) family NADH-FMN oxidoreductase RutF
MRAASHADELRAALGCFATGVAIVTTTTSDRTPVGMTVNSFTSVSLDPPLVLFSIDRRAWSLKAFQSARRFVVNVLREAQKALSIHFARAAMDKWVGITFEIGRGGCPIFRDSLAIFECEWQFSYDGGDHVIFVVKIDRMRFDPRDRPLLFYRGSYQSLRTPADHAICGPDRPVAHVVLEL